MDLNTMAVIEAAYLSARTGMAEEPGADFTSGRSRGVRLAVKQDKRR